MINLSGLKMQMTVTHSTQCVILWDPFQSFRNPNWKCAHICWKVGMRFFLEDFWVWFLFYFLELAVIKWTWWYYINQKLVHYHSFFEKKKKKKKKIFSHRSHRIHEDKANSASCLYHNGFYTIGSISPQFYFMIFLALTYLFELICITSKEIRTYCT